MLTNSSLYKRTRKDHVLNSEPIKLKKEYCEMCFIKFSLTKMKIAHNCKRCFRTVCDTCGTQREIIVGCLDKSDSIHRICNICKEERVQIQQFCQKNMLKWGRSSRISERWLESLGLLSQKKELDEEYQVLKGQISKGMGEFSSRTPELLQIKKDLQGFFTSAISYNYSFCEFLSIIQSDVSNNQIQQEIYNILTRFLFKYPEIGYTSEYLRILTFILCFCSQQDAFFIFSNLIYYTFPPPLFPKQAKLNKMESVEKYIKYIIDDFVLQQSFEEKDLLLLKQFLSGSYFQYYQSIFVNYLPVLVTFSILDNVIMAKEYKVVEKYTKALCFKHLSNMRQVGSNTNQLNEVILRNTTRIQELDKIISQNFKNTNVIYSLDMLDKETFSTIQAQSQSVDLQSQITNLKSSIKSMTEYSKVLHEELQKKNAQIEELNQRANEETSRRNTKEEDELRVLVESLQKRLNEAEMANKNLKVEVFEQNISSMKKSKRFEDEIAGLNQVLLNCQGNLRQETEKSRLTGFHLNQLKMKYNEEGTKMTNLLNQERQRNSILQQQLQQERLIRSPIIDDTNKRANHIGGSVPNSPQLNSIKAFSNNNIENNNYNTPSPRVAGNNNTPSPMMNSKSCSQIACSPANGMNFSPSQNEAEIQRLQGQIQQMQLKLQQQNGYIDTMRSKGQQLQIAYNQLLKDKQTFEQAFYIKEQQNKAAVEEERKQAEEERKQSEEQLIKIHAQAIEEAVKLERYKGEQIIQKMKETLTDQHKKWQIQMQSLNEKMLDANRRCEVAQKTTERLLEEGKAHELNALGLFQQQLSQKQVSIDQKLVIIREKEEEELAMKSEIEKLKEQIVQYLHLERDIATMQIRISELEEELKAQNEETSQVYQQLKQKNEEFSMISEAIEEMKLWKEDKQKQEELMTEKQKSLEEKQRNIDEILNKFEQDQHRLQEEEIALQERQEDIEKKESNIKQKEEDIKTQLNKLAKKEEEILLKEENAREQLKILVKKEQDITERQRDMLGKRNELEARQVRLDEQRTALQKEKEELRNKESACAAREQSLQQLGANLNSQQAEIEREKKKIDEETQRRAAQLEQCQQEESQLQEQKRMHETNLNSIAGMLLQIESSLAKAHSKISQDNETISLQLTAAGTPENSFQQIELSQRNSPQEICKNINLLDIELTSDEQCQYNGVDNCKVGNINYGNQNNLLDNDYDQSLGQAFTDSNTQNFSVAPAIKNLDSTGSFNLLNE